MNRTLGTLILAAVLPLAACATSPTPVLDTHFGVAVNRAKEQQTINPQAGANTDPVAGIGGTAARDSVQRYEDSFRAPPPTFSVISVGGAGGSAR